MSRKNPKAARLEKIPDYSKDEVVSYNGFPAVRRLSGACFNYRADFGRANVQVICSFCNTQQTGFIWSMAGGGKRCYNCKSYIQGGGGYDYAITKQIL